jgi:hypothetical protein
MWLSRNTVIYPGNTCITVSIIAIKMVVIYIFFDYRGNRILTYDFSNTLDHLAYISLSIIYLPFLLMVMEVITSVKFAENYLYGPK